jgi:hypothetical protein
MEPEQYNFPVFGTQGGGLVREGRFQGQYFYIFVEKPDCPGLEIGSLMPKEWGVVPANRQAREMIEAEQFDDFADLTFWD